MLIWPDIIPREVCHWLVRYLIAISSFISKIYLNCKAADGSVVLRIKRTITWNLQGTVWSLAAHIHKAIPKYAGKGGQISVFKKRDYWLQRTISLYASLRHFFRFSIRYLILSWWIVKLRNIYLFDRCKEKNPCFFRDYISFSVRVNWLFDYQLVYIRITL